MRRALKDYRYEVQESKMTDECSQYLTQLQKDWERHRVKMGVEALRKEVFLSFLVDIYPCPTSFVRWESESASARRAETRAL